MFFDTKHQSDFLGYKNLFLTFSEVNVVSSIVKLFLTFCKVKSGQGGQKAAATAAQTGAGKLHKQQRAPNNSNTGKKHQQQEAKEAARAAHPRAQKADTEGLFVLSLTSSRGMFFCFFFEIPVIFITIGY